MPRKDEKGKNGEGAGKPPDAKRVTVTQEMLDAEPEMAEQGIAVGDEIEVAADWEPKPAPEPKGPKPARKKGLPGLGSEDKVKVHNINPRRDINHTFCGKLYVIRAGCVSDPLPRPVAEAIMREWQGARPASEDTGTEPPEEWERRYPNAYAAAKAQHGADGFQVKDTVGPDRPKVVDPPVPSGEDGKPDVKANKFVCPQCLMEFGSHKVKCEHMKSEHGI